MSGIMIKKRCKKCGLLRLETDFYKYKYRGDYNRRKTCKYCSTGVKEYNTIKCKICNSEFTPSSTINIYCCIECKKKADILLRSKKPKNKICKHCGDSFIPYTSLDKFCSQVCRIEDMKSKRKHRYSKDACKSFEGKNNPCYRNGMYVRGKNKTAIGERSFIKNRSEIIKSMISTYNCVYCEHCHTSNSLRFEAHHIVFRSEKPLHKYLHTKENIIILCIGCHNEFHKHKGLRNEIVEKRKLNELFGNDILKQNR